MLAACGCGVSEEAVRIHSETLENMKYTVKTNYGVSSNSYLGTKDEPLFGTDQGSGASPVYQPFNYVGVASWPTNPPNTTKERSQSNNQVYGHRLGGGN